MQIASVRIRVWESRPPGSVSAKPNGLAAQPGDVQPIAAIEKHTILRQTEPPHACTGH
jgi:hypothetical protein